MFDRIYSISNSISITQTAKYSLHQPNSSYGQLAQSQDYQSLGRVQVFA